jgi:hypothetical protein
LRDATVVSNGAFARPAPSDAYEQHWLDLKRLRFRIVNTSTAPVVGSAADLRAISSGATVVPLSGGGTANVGATTLETPPAQSACGGFNATLSPAGVTNDTPLLSGGSINVAFTVGVQGTGPYSFCLVPEGDAAPGSAPLCFAGR